MAATYEDERDTDRDARREVLLPYDLDAERAVLGALMMERRALDESRFLEPDDFHHEPHRDVFKAARQLESRRKIVDFVTVPHELQRMGYSSREAQIAVSGLYNSVPPVPQTEHHARIVLDCSLQRQAIRDAGDQAGDGYHRMEPDALLDAIEQRAFTLRRRLMGCDAPRLTIADDLRTFLDDMEARGKGEMPTGVLTGYAKLDTMTGGLHNTNLVIVAARPGVGKTSLMLSMAYQQAKCGMKVGIFSAEMAREELIERLVSIDSGIPLEVIRSGQLSDEQWTAASQSVAHLNELPILIDDTPSIAITALRSQARRMVTDERVQIIYADYLQLFTPPANDGRRQNNRTQEVGDMAKGLKQLARELHIPVVVLAQLSREVEKRADKTPILSDLRESGDIENNADVVMLLSRDESDEARKHVTDLIVAKHRNGPKGTISLYFQGEQTYYRNLTTTD